MRVTDESLASIFNNAIIAKSASLSMIKSFVRRLKDLNHFSVILP